MLDIIIITYNSAKHIQGCIRSILQSSPQKTNITVIDNKSSDETIKLLSRFKSLRVIRNNKNIGFAKAVNLGIKKTHGRYVLLLNPDTKLYKNSLNQLLTNLRRHKAAIAGGKMLKVDGGVHGSFVREPSIFTLLFDYTNLRKLIPGDIFHKHHYYFDKQDSIKPFIVDAVSGGFMLIKRSALKKNGLFDEKFFMYLEDVDFCIRAKQKRLKTIYCPDSKVFHVGGASSPGKYGINQYAWFRSRQYYAKKHFNKLTNSLVQTMFFFDEAGSLIREWLR